jgi:hypothetical protein
MTPDRRILPGAQAQLVDKAGRATPVLYDFMRRLVGATGSIPVGIAGASFLTATSETTTLPNSRQLVAGDNIEIDDTVDGQLRISAEISSGSGEGYPAQLGYAGIT